jgi:hypothetical protein
VASPNTVHQSAGRRAAWLLRAACGVAVSRRLDAFGALKSGPMVPQAQRRDGDGQRVWMTGDRIFQAQSVVPARREPNSGRSNMGSPPSPRNKLFLIF